MKSYWIWHYGDYEIYHTMNAHLKREERGCHIPAFWRVSTPYLMVKFSKKVTSNGGFLVCHINGDGYVAIDDNRFDPKNRIEIPSGEHKIDIIVSNRSGLPAVFVESDVCPSDESWTANHNAGEFLPVGYKEYFDNADKNPENFPFEYENRQPQKREETENGALFDFGCELFGYLNVETTEKLDVFYGESREEALDTKHSYLCDSIIGKARLKQRAFRYVYLVGDTKDTTVSADFEYLPLEKKGGFCCDNALFNKIYDVAEYTFSLNCREGFFDGIKRDRWIWSGDAYQSARINRYLFLDREIEERTLIGLVGKSPIEQQINTILDYSLFWLIMLYEHYMTFKNEEFVLRIYPMAEELLTFVETRINEDGFLEGKGDDWTFVDWADMDYTGAICAEQMLLIEVYRAMAELSSVLKKQTDYLKKRENLIKKVNEYYWNEQKGAFVDSYKSGLENVTRHPNIFAVIYGIATEEQKKSILENVLKNDSIKKITTPYFEGYELDALAILGEYTRIENTLKSYWGGMIELGAETVWEEFDPNKSGVEHYAMYGRRYEKSLCHAWGATPIYLFGRYYLGVYATSAGYETFEVCPKLGGLEKIEGTVPINGGAVSVKLDRETLSVNSTKAGGTLVWEGKRYPLIPNETLVFARRV